MNRPIKFKAWDKKGRKWLRDFSVHETGALLHLINSIEEDPDIALMQFTGLTDKNGVEIYEGDIVHDISGKPALVKFGGYSAGGMDYYATPAYGFFVQCISGGEEVEDDTETLGAYGPNEVIGNVFENPELIEKEV